MSFKVSGGAVVTFCTITAHLLDWYVPVSVSELHTFIRSLIEGKKHKFLISSIYFFGHEIRAEYSSEAMTLYSITLIVIAAPTYMYVCSINQNMKAQCTCPCRS